MLRGVLCEEVVLALVFKPMHYLHPRAAEWCNYNDLFITKFELCRLKNKDENEDDDDDNEKPDETAVFCNSGLAFSVER